MIGFPINTNIPMTRQMSYRIPSEDEVAKAIENVLVRTPHMRSQRDSCAWTRTTASGRRESAG